MQFYLIYYNLFGPFRTPYYNYYNTIIMVLVNLSKIAYCTILPLRERVEFVISTLVCCYVNTIYWSCCCLFGALTNKHRCIAFGSYMTTPAVTYECGRSYFIKQVTREQLVLRHIPRPRKINKHLLSCWKRHVTSGQNLL